MGTGYYGSGSNGVSGAAYLSGNPKNSVGKNELAPPSNNNNAQTCEQVRQSCYSNCEKERGGGPGFYERCIERCDEKYEKCKGRSNNAANNGNNANNNATAGCPEGVGKAYANNPQACPCGEAYGTYTGTCAGGYKFVARDDPKAFEKKGVEYKEGMVGTCHCKQAVADWYAAHPGARGGGEFQFPPELQALYDQLLGKAGMLLNREPGIPDDVLNLMFGENFEKIRGMENATRENVLGTLAQQGRLGTGTAADLLSKTAWNTENEIANIRRNIAIYESEKELEDLLKQFAGAQGLFGTGVGYQQLLEQINAARRGESMDWMQLWMSFLSLLMNSWAQ